MEADQQDVFLHHAQRGRSIVPGLAAHCDVAASGSYYTHTYELDFNKRFLESGDARAVKSSPDFIKMRETILSIIYGDERASGNPELAHA